MKNIPLLKVISATLIVSILALTSYVYIESEMSNVVYAITAADQVVVTLNVDTGISITDSPNVSMSQNLGVVALTATASSTWNVKTNNALGYSLTVLASTTPAMQSGSNSVADYPAYTPETWNVTNAAYFGFSARGTDVVAGFGSDTDCQAAQHVPSATLNYRRLSATTTVQIATRTSTTTTTGVDSTVCWAVEQDNFYIPSGTYTATVTATATTL